jgi:hypothetical protein
MRHHSKGCDVNRRLSRRGVIAIAITIGLVFAPVHAWNDKDDGSFTPQERAAVDQVDAEVDGFMAKVSDVLAGTDKRMCSPQYDYPGCTPSQQRALEAPDKSDFKANYDKGRWGQGNNGGQTRAQWANLTEASNDKMRRMYDDAVEQYESTATAKGLTGKRAEAHFQTWHGFKEAMDCGGNMGVFTGLVSGWCRSQKPINVLVEDTEKLVMNCGGDVIAGGVAGGGMSWMKWAATTIKVGAMRGSVVGWIPCVVDTLWDLLFSWVDKAKTHLLDPARGVS